ncbi:MAG: 3-hydroxyacyl-ACP dehydratase FabZ [Bacillota bacterium]
MYEVPMDVSAIKEILPHRYPCLLIDRVIELEPGKRAVGIKNVTANENYFSGHYPDMPIMPGVLILEAMAQLSGIALMTCHPLTPDMIPLFAGADRVRFRKAVAPGDQLRLETEVEKVRKRMAKVKTSAFVEGDLVAEGVLAFAFMDRSEQ